MAASLLNIIGNSEILALSNYHIIKLGFSWAASGIEK